MTIFYAALFIVIRRPFETGLNTYEAYYLVQYNFSLQMNQEIFQACRQQIKTHGLYLIKTITQTIRPYLPALVQNHDIIPIVIMMAGILLPVAAGSTMTAAQILERLVLFGFDSTGQLAKVAANTTVGTASFATDLLVNKPLYMLSYPFKKYAQNQEIMKSLQLSRVQQKERQTYKQKYKGATLESDKLFLIIREINTPVTRKQDIKVLIGSLDTNDRVGRLLQLVRKNASLPQTQSIQFICDGVMLKMDSKLSTLPRNQFGAIEIYYAQLEVFG